MTSISFAIQKDTSGCYTRRPCRQGGDGLEAVNSAREAPSHRRDPCPDPTRLPAGRQLVKTVTVRLRVSLLLQPGRSTP